MTVSNKTFIAIFTAFATLAFLALPVFNYTLDRYRVFHSLNNDFSSFYARKDGVFDWNYNDRIMPLSYLLKHRENYDSFILSNSRGDMFNTPQFGSRWFLLNYRGGNMPEHLRHLKTLIRTGPVKNILLAIDSFQFRSDKIIKALNRYPYPDEFTDWLELYRLYLFKIPDQRDFELLTRKDYRLDDLPEWYYTRIKQRYDYTPPTDIRRGMTRSILDFRPPTSSVRLADDAIRNNLETLRQFIELARQNHITLNILYHPIHYKYLYSLDTDKVDTIKKGIAALQPFYDFGTVNPVTLNNDYWYDTKHYLPGAANMILDVITGKKTYPNYGNRVTPGMVDRYLKANRRIMQKYLPALLLTDKNLLPHASLSGRPVFAPDLHDDNFVVRYRHVKHLARDRSISFEADGGDPQLLLRTPDDSGKAEGRLIKIEIDSPADTLFMLTYVIAAPDRKLFRYQKTINKGDNLMYIPVSPGKLDGAMSIRLKSANGTFTLRGFEILPLS